MLYDNMCFLLDQRKIYLDKDISLVRLSQMLYTNTTYLSRVINKYFGCNLKALLNRYRVKHAKDLLGDENCNMEELPALCGFSSRSAFYNAFVRFEHMTPTDYRALVRMQALRSGSVSSTVPSRSNNTAFSICLYENFSGVSFVFYNKFNLRPRLLRRHSHSLNLL